jgi:hypothetical protein
LTGLEPSRHGAGRHAADDLAIEQFVALAKHGGQAVDDGRVLLDETQIVAECIEQVAPGPRVDAGILRVGVELGLAQEQAGVEHAGLADRRQQSCRVVGVHSVFEHMIAEGVDVFSGRMHRRGAQLMGGAHDFKPRVGLRRRRTRFWLTNRNLHRGGFKAATRFTRGAP